MVSKLKLSVGLAYELEMAMNRNGGWDSLLVKRLCEGSNLTLVRDFLQGNRVVGAQPQSTTLTTAIDVAPERAMYIYKKSNRSYIYVRPAVLSADEVREILCYFSGTSLQAMSLLLIENKNEPRQEIFSTDVEDNPLRWMRREINNLLENAMVNSKHFHLAGYRVKSRHMWEFQLWEINKG